MAMTYARVREEHERQAPLAHEAGRRKASSPAVHHKHGSELVLKLVVLLAIDAERREAQRA